MDASATGESEPDGSWWSSTIGRVVAVTGSQAVVMLNVDHITDTPGPRVPSIGSLLKFTSTRAAVVIAIVSGMSIPAPASASGEREMFLIEIEFVGEFPRLPAGKSGPFRRGVSVHPTLGDPAFMANREDYARIFDSREAAQIRLGVTYQDPTIPVPVGIDPLFQNHGAMLGSMGAEPFPLVALLLRRVIEKLPSAHILLLDTRGKYAPILGNAAEIITSDNFSLPFWLLTGEELAEIVFDPDEARQTSFEILCELMAQAKIRYRANQRHGEAFAPNNSLVAESMSISGDMPAPYRIADLLALLDQRMRQPQSQDALSACRKLKAQIEAVVGDPAFAFLFGNVALQADMADILARLFRVPVEDKPIAVLELGSLPSKAAGTVISTLSRLAFALNLLNRGEMPIALVCEDAHHFAPNRDCQRPNIARRALLRIARQGEQRGVALIITSDRPAEVDPALLSHCSTIFSMRLSNERDQVCVQAALSDVSTGLAAFLPTLGPGEALVSGPAVPMPVRSRFDDITEAHTPSRPQTSFYERWYGNQMGHDNLEALVQRGRAQVEAGAPTPSAPSLSSPSPTLPRMIEVAASENDGPPASSALVDEAASMPPLPSVSSPAAPDGQEATTEGVRERDKVLRADFPFPGEVQRMSSTEPRRRAHPSDAVDWRSLRMRIISDTTQDVDDPAPEKT